MSLKILELHHHAVRVQAGDASLDAAVRFYRDVLGLEMDATRPAIDLKGAWMNVGDGAQIHLMAIEGPSSACFGPGKDPSNPHVALAVADIQKARAQLDQQGIAYFVLNVMPGADAEQLFLIDPAGNTVELHQLGSCRCARSRT
jgi:catechol 2,3-dioxygenase-like lactoylglutathione lyase family enzyme